MVRAYDPPPRPAQPCSSNRRSTLWLTALQLSPPCRADVDLHSSDILREPPRLSVARVSAETWPPRRKLHDAQLVLSLSSRRRASSARPTAIPVLYELLRSPDPRLCRLHHPVSATSDLDALSSWPQIRLPNPSNPSIPCRPELRRHPLSRSPFTVPGGAAFEPPTLVLFPLASTGDTMARAAGAHQVIVFEPSAVSSSSIPLRPMISGGLSVRSPLFMFPKWLLFLSLHPSLFLN
ncbi:basic proline-rich protein-like [Iris pallida]|uniref:Basic proline-rich protein-like n=1 Tax=Iris pallida TaxID=29817 RepID=A0AAX6G4L3_IRIPA|nr:basic proline-rich protein-like [Iris pallida]